MEVLKLKKDETIPENYTGIAEYESGNKYWYKEDLLHRIDGPAIEYSDGRKEWYIDGEQFNSYSLNFLILDSLYLGTEKGKYDLLWLRFFTEEGIKEFPFISGMEKEKRYISLFGIFLTIEDLEGIEL